MPFIQSKLLSHSLCTSLLCLSLLPGAANAGPITPSISGYVGRLPGGASWVGPSEGFVFMAFYDSEAGREPTLRNPTGGFHVASVMPDGSYRIQVLESLLPSCGRVQFDAQGYLATGGLDPSQLHTLVFDTGVDCVPGQAARRSPSATPEDFNEEGTGGQPPGSLFFVPDESSSLLLLALSLVAVMGRAGKVARNAFGQTSG